jgi:hypothetical protein
LLFGFGGLGLLVPLATTTYDDSADIFVLWKENTGDVMAGIEDDEQWWPAGYYRYDLR